MTIGDFLGGGNAVKVNTDVLITKANEVEDKVKTMRANIQEIEELVEETRNYWIGEGGDAHRKLYETQKEDVEEILNRLAEHPVNLRTVATQVYGGLVDENKSVAEALPGDAIS